VCDSNLIFLAARIDVGFEWFRILCSFVEELVDSFVEGLVGSSVGERHCSWMVGHCSFADVQLGLGLEQGRLVDSCSSGRGQIDVGLGQVVDDHLLGILGCSIFHHKLHHRIGLTCHRDQHSSFELELVDIVVEQLEGLAVVVLEVRRANGLHWLGIYLKNKEVWVSIECQGVR
jgi:hypothetical protein